MVILKVLFLPHSIRIEISLQIKIHKVINVTLVKTGDIIKLVLYITEEVKPNILNWKLSSFKLI